VSEVLEVSGETAGSGRVSGLPAVLEVGLHPETVVADLLLLGELVPAGSELLYGGDQQSPGDKRGGELVPAKRDQ
jgi:hypothetical protein